MGYWTTRGYIEDDSVSFWTLAGAFEAASGGSAMTLSVSDSIAISDAPSNSVEQGALTDSFTLAEARSMAVSKPFLDSFSLADSIDALVTLILNVSDSLSLSDTQTLAYGKSVAESLGLSDDLVKAIAVALQDTFALSWALDLNNASPGDLEGSGKPTTLTIVSPENTVDFRSENWMNLCKIT